MIFGSRLWNVLLFAVVLSATKVLAQNAQLSNTSASLQPRSSHVFIVMLENRSQFEALQFMPYLSSLANSNGIAVQVYSPSHGSWLAYGELTAGIAPFEGEAENGICNGDGCTDTLDIENLVRQFTVDGKTWRGYFQSIPYSGFMGYSSGEYVRRHNPFPFYTDVAFDHSEQLNMVSDLQFSADVAAGAAPNYSFIVPDLIHDGHDPGDDSQLALANADNYLASLLPQLLSSPYFQPGGDGVLIVTFDESDLYGDDQCGTNPDPKNCGGHIFMAVIGPSVKRGFQSSIHYSQRDILRTTCDLLGLSACPGDAALGLSMTEFFGPDPVSVPPCPPPDSPGVSVCLPRAGESAASPVLVVGSGAGASGVVERMELWIDGQKIGNYPGSHIYTYAPLSAGPHAATLVEVDSDGNFIKSDHLLFHSY